MAPPTRSTEGHSTASVPLSAFFALQTQPFDCGGAKRRPRRPTDRSGAEPGKLAWTKQPGRSSLDGER
ncbi:MAG: hypothetical protein AAGF99_16195 [Bacteroidota bacterium]